MNDYETGWDRTDRLIINLVRALAIEENPKKKKEIQEMIDEITKPRSPEE
jgi:hypothetical protein